MVSFGPRLLLSAINPSAAMIFSPKPFTGFAVAPAAFSLQPSAFS
jgi:hypothetical protein